MASEYGLATPSEERTLESFERILGEQEGRRIWENARKATGLHEYESPLTPDQLRVIADHLAVQEGLVGILGASLQTRLKTHSILTKMDGAPAAGDGVPSDIDARPGGTDGQPSHTDGSAARKDGQSSDPHRSPHGPDAAGNSEAGDAR